MEEISISIIVPVYNVESYLERCINSIIAQSWNNWELILIDDGSTDQSPQICDRYCKKDKRIKVIHQENAGVSATRNVGISNAVGNYIGFVDADDWIETKMYERLVIEISKTHYDVIMCDATTIYSNGKMELDTISQLPGSTTINKEEITPKLLLELAGSVCRCLYSAELVKKKGCDFPIGIKFSEDRIFNIKNFGQARKIRYIKESYYNRFINTQSAVHRFHMDYFKACKSASYAIRQAIEFSWDNSEEFQKAYLGQLLSGAYSAICNYYYKTSMLSGKEKKKMVKEICDDPYLRYAIEICGGDIKSQWILEKKYNFLIVYAKLANFKHGR